MKYLDVNQDKVIDTLKIADWRIQKKVINIIGSLIQALMLYFRYYVCQVHSFSSL
jgi:hypothetical protein